MGIKYFFWGLNKVTLCRLLDSLYTGRGEKEKLEKEGQEDFSTFLYHSPKRALGTHGSVSEQMLELGTAWSCSLCSSPRVSSHFAFYILEPERLACSHLHLEKLPLKWFPKSSAGNYPSSCWYKAEWAVRAATKAAHAERPASLFESWIGQLLGRGLGFASSVSLLDAAAQHQMSYCTILIEKSFSRNWSV